MDEIISEVVLRTDITKRVAGFHNKKFLNKPVSDVQAKFNKTARRKLKHQRKTKGGTIPQRKREYADLKRTQGMIVVAHKNKNIRPMKPVKESAAETVLRVVREMTGG